MRRITKRAELDALPDSAVVHDGRGDGPYSVWIKDAAMGWDDVVWWQGGSDVPSPAPDIPLPALVIYEASE